MKRIVFIAVCCLVVFSLQAQKIKIKTGLEVLKEQNFKCLEGKRVGVITNPIGVDNNLKSIVDILYDAPNVELVALYGPAHGVRGDVHAGYHIEHFVVANSALRVHFLLRA